MIQGHGRKLRHCNDGTEELATTPEASEEEDEPEDSTVDNVGIGGGSRRHNTPK